METQKAVFLIVGVFVAGLVLGYTFSGGDDITGQALKIINDDGGSSGNVRCPSGSTGVWVSCPYGGTYYVCATPGAIIYCENYKPVCYDPGTGKDCPKPR